MQRDGGVKEPRNKRAKKLGNKVKRNNAKKPRRKAEARKSFENCELRHGNSNDWRKCYCMRLNGRPLKRRRQRRALGCWGYGDATPDLSLQERPGVVCEFLYRTVPNEARCYGVDGVVLKSLNYPVDTK